MNNLIDELKKLLKTEKKYVTKDNYLLNSQIYTDIMKMDKKLINLLLSNKKIKDLFFVEVNNNLVFDKQQFLWVLNSKEFLEDSYTSYKNKIGLYSNSQFLSQNNDVVLSFPFKDCTLRGGQDKESQRRNEVFLNNIIAREDIRRLLAPKVITNIKRHSKEGVSSEIESFNDSNLIIKGNNLLVISSLLQNYTGKVKMIYIDPPYNTGSDGFNYNDNFNRSTWLTFMKNRLEIAKSLLTEDGTVFVQIDNIEMHYLKILMDEIFQEENFITTLTLKVKAPSGVAAGAQMFFDNSEYILVYAKNKSMNTYHNLQVDAEIVDESSKTSDNYRFLLEKFDDRNKKFVTNIDDAKIYEIPNKDFKVSRMKNLSSEEYFEQFDKVFRTAALSGGLEKKIHKYINKLDNSNNRFFVYEYTPSRGRSKGKFVQNKIYKKGGLLMLKDFSRLDKKTKKVYKQEHITNLISNDWWQGIASEGGVTLKNGKKPEVLLKTLIEIATDEGDTVLDFFLGSGTTTAVAHKMNRKYIGIEQMDYIKSITLKRMKNVINGDQSGISQEVNWKGGGDFVYFELKENNYNIINKINHASPNDILSLKEEIFSTDNLLPHLTTREVNKFENSFEELSLFEKKKILIDLIDKNKLYINYSDIEDQEYNISNKDKNINKIFYGDKNEK